VGGQVQHRGAEPPQNKAKRLVELRAARDVRAMRLGHQGLERGTLQRGGHDAVAVVVDQSGKVDHRRPQ